MIHSYGKNASLRGFRFLGGDVEQDIFFGIEIETIFQGQSKAERFSEDFKDVTFVKTDGSLNSGGFEVATMPMTYEFFKSDRVKEMYKKLQEISCPDSSCGGHIHVSRKYFKDFQIRKIMYLITKMKPENLKKCFGRSFQSYANKPNIATDIEKTNITQGRISVHVGEKTVEFRLFDATTSYKQQLKYLNLIHRLHKVSIDVSFDRLKTMDIHGITSLVDADYEIPELRIYEEILSLKKIKERLSYANAQRRDALEMSYYADYDKKIISMVNVMKPDAEYTKKMYNRAGLLPKDIRELCWMWTSESNRRRGLAKILIKKAQLNNDALCCFIEAGNSTSFKIMTACGFTVTKIFNNEYTNNNVIIMEWNKPTIVPKEEITI